MIDHLTTYATDYEATRGFYDAVLEALGYRRLTEMKMHWDRENPARRTCCYGPEGRYIFWVSEVETPATPRHIAFHAKSRALVDAFYEAAMQVGARDNGKPGPRPEYHPSYYGAFVLDPDGNNVEAVCHKAE